MPITNFEDIAAWQSARELARAVYQLTRGEKFSRDFGLKDQIRRAAGSAMHNIAEGFDSGTNTEFTKFLRYAQRSCTEVKSQLYLALDEGYLTQNEFEATYAKASTTHAKIGGFIRYLLNNPRNKS